jgi:hypothetical protein
VGVVLVIKCSSVAELYMKHVYIKHRAWVWGEPRSLPFSSKLCLELGATRASLQLRPGGGYTGQFVPAWWRWRQGKLLQFPKKEVIAVASFIIYRGCKNCSSLTESFLNRVPSCCPSWRWCTQAAASHRALSRDSS